MPGLPCEGGHFGKDDFGIRFEKAVLTAVPLAVTLTFSLHVPRGNARNRLCALKREHSDRTP